MNWRSESVLWLLLLVPLFVGLALVAWRLRLRATARFGDPGIVRSLVFGRSGPWRAARGALLAVGLALLVIALAGPQYGSQTRMLRKRGVDVVIALDFSKSMLARDVRPDRIERAKAEIGRLLEDLDGDRIGIVAFAGETLEFPMTTDYAALQLFLRDLGPYDMPVGGTAIGRALLASRNLLQRSTPQVPEGQPSTRSQIVILFTDGEETGDSDPIAAARELAEDGIKVYTIGIGSRTGESIPAYAPDGTFIGYMRDEQGNPILTSLTAEAEDDLREIAQITGGSYHRARQGGVGVDEIRAEMRRMQQAEREARRVTIHEDRYALVLLPAFLFVLLESLLPDAWVGRRRRPKPFVKPSKERTA